MILRFHAGPPYEVRADCMNSFSMSKGVFDRILRSRLSTGSGITLTSTAFVASIIKVFFSFGFVSKDTDTGDECLLL